VDTQEGDEKSLLEHYRRFLAFRRANPALAKGDIDFLGADDNVVVFMRGLGNEQLVCAFNLSPRTAEIDLGADTVLEAVQGHGLDGKATGGKVALGAYGAWFGRMG
jgi:alpha-glucosidase